ncbi:hypothetical protein F511_30587 [Dorcoceras hygrometricum]|uniref:Uncharacterized protein n=1 Tax=Dorcoceras hygrometricum TaxID=472368 RepID=A0A2Z7AQW4_9LAMI|nr:hypothetical protein F511_30587 [Dorcoceras hygrometricum]
MGCPGQARTKPRSKIQPSQQSAGDRRWTAAAATTQHATLSRMLGRNVHDGVARDAPSPTRNKLRCTACGARPHVPAHWPACAQHFAQPAAAVTLGHCATIVQAGALICARHCAASGHEPRAHMRAVKGRGSRPRPEGRLLRQPALEGLTRSARTDSPRKTDRSKSDQLAAAAEAGGGGGFWERKGAAHLGALGDTASRGPTTIAAPESQFRTCPSDHDNIGYPRMSASGESSTTMDRILHASGPHPIPPPNDPNRRPSLVFKSYMGLNRPNGLGSSPYPYERRRGGGGGGREVLGGEGAAHKSWRLGVLV